MLKENMDKLNKSSDDLEEEIKKLSVTIEKVN
jgi:prefoldin subunit 5